MVRRLIMELLEAIKAHFNSEVLTGKYELLKIAKLCGA
jgi:hypothetical protein